ncbi:hypothetical protein [Amycolatopsis pretoriensis]|uniref:hypothetical protein n=1 Tax=Amycolatopsis pretoriensis TaxID=218821 RepID=UPI00115FBD66|nr:hypothetical protein [Amycolatopsis pretoriensis]
MSAKPFWLAFWIPTSPVVGLIVALRPSGDFDREVVEFRAGQGRVRTRWRDYRSAETFLAVVRDKVPDLEVRYGVDPAAPRLGAGGGFLAFALGVWLFFGTWFGLQLLDQSLDRGPFPPGPTSAAITRLTAGLSGFALLPGAARDFTEWPCDRINDLALGPDPAPPTSTSSWWARSRRRAPSRRG